MNSDSSRCYCRDGEVCNRMVKWQGDMDGGRSWEFEREREREREERKESMQE